MNERDAFWRLVADAIASLLALLAQYRFQKDFSKERSASVHFHQFGRSQDMRTLFYPLNTVGASNYQQQQKFPSANASTLKQRFGKIAVFSFYRVF